MNPRNAALPDAAGRIAARPGDERPNGTPNAIVLLASRLGMGGAERHTITLANLLSHRFRVVVAYLKPEEDMIGQLDRDSLLEVRCLHARRKIDMRAARELAELAQKHGASIVVCANAFALMYAQLARLMTRTPLTVVEIFHTTKLRTLKEHLELAFYRPFFWTADHLVFVCEGQRKYWLRLGLTARKTHMIYNGVDAAHFNPDPYARAVATTRASFGWTVDDRVVGICAVLRPEKAHTDLIAAVARCHRDGQPWKLLVIGDGPMRNLIEQEVVRSGLQPDVHITGFESDVRGLLAACDAVALPSTAIETFSIAALEAMAMGKPMIMSDVGGAREQVNHGSNGLLFPAGDIKALAACLRRMWDKSGAQRMGAVGRERVEREFSVHHMNDCYVKLLESMFGTAGQSKAGEPD